MLGPADCLQALTRFLLKKVHATTIMPLQIQRFGLCTLNPWADFPKKVDMIIPLNENT